MKKNFNTIKISIFLIAISLGFSSCGDFLEIEPKTLVTEDNFWNEKTDVDQMVSGVYVAMQSEDFIKRCIVWGELRGDNVDDAITAKTKYKDIYEANVSTLKSTNSFTSWAPMYAVINRCNNVIENAPIVSQKDPSYTESDVEATIAEMTAIRALCYFYLVRTFKDVPYYTNAINAEDEVEALPASKGDSILAVCLDDLASNVDKAIQVYPQTEVSGGKTCNRINKNAMYAIMADISLWLKDYDDAITYSEYVIADKKKEYNNDYSNVGSGVSLYSYPSDDGVTYPSYPLIQCNNMQDYSYSYNEIFGDGNSYESLFELQYSTTDITAGTGVANNAVGVLYGNHWLSNGNAGKGYIMVDYNLSYACLDGKIIPESDPQHDARMYTSFTAGSNKFDDATITKYVASEATVSTDLVGTAYIPPTSGLPGRSFLYSIRSDCNWIFYRLTDVMLIKAEALIERNEGDDLDQAFAIIWAVNRRSEMDKDKNTTEATTYSLARRNYTTQEEMRKLCLAERRMEFLFEGKRWFDLVRLSERFNDPSQARSYCSSAQKYSAAGSSLLLSMEALYWPYNKQELKVNSNIHQKQYYASEDDDAFEKNN